MGCRIIYDQEEDMAVLYDSVTMTCFGPVFDGPEAQEEAQAFVDWYETEYGGDPRKAGALRREPRRAREVTVKKAQGKSELSARALGVLHSAVRADHDRCHGLDHGGLFDPRTLSLSELLRRAAKIEPPLSYDSLWRRHKRCGKRTAAEVCKSLGLPVPQPDQKKAQCPRCGHVFGGPR